MRELEIDLFLCTVDAAIDLAFARQPEEGAKELRYGLERAQAALRDGEEWAPEMAERYQQALTNYCFRYRVRRIDSREEQR